jgi:hypothetical protein
MSWLSSRFSSKGNKKEKEEEENKKQSSKMNEGKTIKFTSLSLERSLYMISEEYKNHQLECRNITRESIEKWGLENDEFNSSNDMIIREMDAGFLFTLRFKDLTKVELFQKNCEYLPFPLIFMERPLKLRENNEKQLFLNFQPLPTRSNTSIVSVIIISLLIMIFCIYSLVELNRERLVEFQTFYNYIIIPLWNFKNYFF